MVLKLEINMVSKKTANIGDRIECQGHFGTIKYIGLVESYSNDWLGIDWDDQNRGKHNGTVNGVRYFNARWDKSGSFVRPEKVQLGQSVVNAITSRYGQREDAASAKLTEQQLLSIKQTINAPFVELVGFEKVTDKQSDFNNLQVVNLRLQNVSVIGGPDDLRILCPNVTELDISKNLLTNWSQVFSICLQLEYLQWLNVSENLLVIPENYDEYSFPNLNILICGMMQLNWNDALKLSKVFRNVEELRVPHNNIKTLTMTDEFSQLKLLDLEGNHIQDWNEICKLTVITSLEQINLENTGISRIKFEGANIFRNLKKLIISDNLIGDWEAIGELNKLPALEDLRFLKNPVLEKESYATCIQLIVARIANLKVLNGATIRPDERKGAEYDYIKKYGLEWLSVRNKPEEKAEFLKRHNRYEELIQKHGTPEESELVVQSKLIKVSLVEVHFVHNQHKIVKKLPPSILIQKLIMLAQRLFNLHRRPNLTYISGVKSEIEIELNDEGKELGFYSVQNGDKIIVKN